MKTSREFLCFPLLQILIFVFFLLLPSHAEFQNISSFDPEPAALIRVDLTGIVGSIVPRSLGPTNLPVSTFATLLDGFFSPPPGYWESKVKSQLRFAHYRMTNRRKIYPTKGQLVLPPEEVWTTQIIPGTTKITTINGEIYVTVSYNVSSYLLVRRGSVKISEPALATIGGKWSEEFDLPLDSDYFFQRTGYACLDQSDHGIDYVEPYNAWNYFNETCDIGSSCNPFQNVTVSCSEALKVNTGKAKVSVTWQRVSFDQNTADSVRVAPQNFEVRDLVNIPRNDISVFYRYIPADDCLRTVSKCILASGWRRFLSFTTSSLNSGLARFLRVGNIGPQGHLQSFLSHGTFSFDSCFNQYKLTDFARYSVGKYNGAAVATCIRDSWRYQNHEYSPLASKFDNCTYQGVSSGWAFDLPVGSPCQWVDITPIKKNNVYNVSSEINPLDFICEGYQNLNPPPKQPIFSNSTTVTIHNQTQTVDIPGCEYSAPNVKSNNKVVIPFSPKSTRATVTSSCPKNSRPYSQWRDCGWSVAVEALTCQPGQMTNILISNNYQNRTKLPTIVVRVCESSRALGEISTRCDYTSALTHGIVPPSETEGLIFTCPEKRDSVETGGLFSVLYAKYTTWEYLGKNVPPVEVQVLSPPPFAL